jgi:hypothetical protein
VSAFSRAVGRIAAAWALALAPLTGREIIENPECGRDEILLVPDGPILLHPLLMIDRAHDDLHDRLDATIGWHVTEAERRLDAAIARLARQSKADQWQIWLHELAGQVGEQMALEIAVDRAQDERRQRDLERRFMVDHMLARHHLVQGRQASFVLVDETRT